MAENTSSSSSTWCLSCRHIQRSTRFFPAIEWSYRQILQQHQSSLLKKSFRRHLDHLNRKTMRNLEDPVLRVSASYCVPMPRRARVPSLYPSFRLLTKILFLGLTPPAGCAVWDQIWEREDLIAFASSYHDSMLGLC